MVFIVVKIFSYLQGKMLYRSVPEQSMHLGKKLEKGALFSNFLGFMILVFAIKIDVK